MLEGMFEDVRRRLGRSARILTPTGTMLKEAGIPAAVVIDLICHGSEQMSEHYTQVGSEALKKAAGALPDFTL